MPLAVRLLLAGEIETFRRIRLEALHREPASFASSAADWEAAPPGDWRRRLAIGPVAVAFRDEEPVGLMGLIPEGGRRMAHRGTLIMVYVRREERGAGLASRLLATVAAAGEALGIRQIELHTSVENPTALGFYRREGFVEIGRMPAAFIHDGREIGEVVMVRQAP